MIDSLNKECEHLKADLDDQINRSMRSNIVVKGIPDEENESWNTSKEKLASHLSKLSGENKSDIKDQLDRVHRSGKFVRGGKPRNIYANFPHSTDAAYYIDLSTKSRIKLKSNATWRVEHQYSKSLTKRPNEALIQRRTLMKLTRNCRKIWQQKKTKSTI